jgi:hypothetical protein
MSAAGVLFPVLFSRILSFYVSLECGMKRFEAKRILK